MRCEKNWNSPISALALNMRIWIWLNSKIVLISDMEFHHMVCHAKSYHGTMQWVGVGVAKSTWQWKSVENKAKSSRQVFTIGYVVFKYSRRKQRGEGKIENSVCVLRHQPRRYGACVKIVFTFIFSHTAANTPDSHAYGSPLFE